METAVVLIIGAGAAGLAAAQRLAAAGMRTIVIEVSGGVLVDVYTDDPDLSVLLVNWDVDGYEPGDYYVRQIRDGLSNTMLVGEQSNYCYTDAGQSKRTAASREGSSSCPTISRRNFDRCDPFTTPGVQCEVHARSKKGVARGRFGAARRPGA